MTNIIEVSPVKLKFFKQAFIQAGPKKLHVLADFDRTLTKAFVNGRETPSLISILRDEDYLTTDYSEKAKALYRQYHAIEIDPNVTLEKKKKAMREWWSKHFELLIASGLTRQDIAKAMSSGRVQLRAGATEFFQLLRKHSIPLVIMSSSGLGGDSIKLLLQKGKLLSENIHVVSNNFRWDAQGRAVGIQEPIIHVLNKDETMVKDRPFYKAIKDRKNVLLLGDSAGDAGMIVGFDYRNLIKIGFLNEGGSEYLAQYKELYDVIILKDGTLDWVNLFLQDIYKA